MRTLTASPTAPVADDATTVPLRIPQPPPQTITFWTDAEDGSPHQVTVTFGPDTVA